MGLDFAKIRAANAAKAAQNDSTQTTQSAPDTSTRDDAGSAGNQQNGNVARPQPTINRLASFMATPQPARSEPSTEVPVSESVRVDGSAETNPGSVAVDDSDMEGAELGQQATPADASLESQEAKTIQVPVLMRLNAAAPADSGVQEEKLDIIPPGPEGFKERLARLDRLIQADNGVTEINIGVARNYVKEVAIELKEFPEYMGIMKPLDIHNVMVFMRGTMAMAEKGFEKKDAASEKRATKKAAGAKFDFSGFDPAATPALPGSAGAAAQGGLDAFANFDASKIPTLSRKG